jgi:hypothetical protein
MKQKIFHNNFLPYNTMVKCYCSYYFNKTEKEEMFESITFQHNLPAYNAPIPEQFKFLDAIYEEPVWVLLQSSLHHLLHFVIA